MASLFSKIPSLIDFGTDSSSNSIGDDNSAMSAKDMNNYVAPAALAARNAYDTLHRLMGPLVQGQKNNLKQITKWLDDWKAQLEKVKKMYEELLKKIKDLSNNFEAAFTLDFAKEAWEILQDTPIVRRYMGEANYWYLYDTLGLLATQTGSMAGDVAAGVRNAIKQAILGLISMTNGLLCLEAYLGMLQQYWGALYLKGIPVYLFDSICPQVTCAYYYKPTHSSKITSHIDPTQTFSVRNPLPGDGFCPIPLPIPDAGVVLTNPDVSMPKIDYQDPATWYVNGDIDGPSWYIGRTTDLLWQALNYWGSSYRNASPPLVERLYHIRDYTAREDGEHPFQAPKTFSQLDTDYYGYAPTENEDETDFSFDTVFTDELVEIMDRWQTNYDRAKNAAVRWLTAKETAVNQALSAAGSEEKVDLHTVKGLAESNKVVDPTVTGATQSVYVSWLVFSTGYTTDAIVSSEDEAARTEFFGYLSAMRDAWRDIAKIYNRNHPRTTADGMTYGVDGSDYHGAYVEIMGALNKAIKTTNNAIAEDAIYITSVASDGEFSNSMLFDITGTIRVPGCLWMAYAINKVPTDYKMYARADDPTKNDVIRKTLESSFVMFPDIFCPETGKYVFSLGRFYNAMVIPQRQLSQVDMLISNCTTVELDNGKTRAVTSADTQVMPYISNYVDIYGPQLVGVMDDIEPIGPLEEGQMSGLAWGMSAYGEYATPLFPDGNISSTSTIPTFVEKYRSLKENVDANQDEFIDIVGDSIQGGRKSLFPCFGIYGNLLSMQTWDYKEMPFEQFKENYARTRSGSSIYYEKNNPGHVIFYHSSYVSQSRQLQMAIYHEALEQESKSYGPEDAYTFYIFPTESISVSKVPEGFVAGALLSVNAESPSGEKYHYATMRNPIPKCAKYVDPEKWSIMDILHEMYLLAENLSDLCGDNGERLRNFHEDFDAFSISRPTFIGQLPTDNGKYALFEFGIFNDYAEKIEELVKSVYDFRAQIIAATNSL